MCASYNLLGKLLSPYHLHVYTICACIYFTQYLYVNNTPPLTDYMTPSHSALNQQTPEIEHSFEYSCVECFASN